MTLKVAMVIVAYLLFKGGCVIVNESEGIKFTIPKLLERASLGAIAFVTQVMFF